jgi:hypothetical protein
MKLVIFLLTILGISALAQVAPSPVASVAPVAAAAPSVLSGLVAWLVAHEVVVSGLVVGLLDFLFALVPSWQSNGILHWVFLQAQNLSGQKPPASS